MSTRLKGGGGAAEAGCVREVVVVCGWHSRGQGSGSGRATPSSLVLRDGE